ncbi:MAG TPA: hypothetical protein VLG50_02935, partial [Candidatus Saccharimonadales bacterium]|nr:hypothetical protein [Candidatus Saccharimonadales bacterium]
LTPEEQQFLNEFETKHKKMMRLRSKHASALRSKKESDAVFVSYNLKQELMYLVEDFGFENSQKKLFKSANWNTFVNSLVDGLKLQQIGPDQVYAQNTVQEILLGYMLAKSHNRSDLENYFKAFLRDNNFVLPEEMYTEIEIKERLASHVNAKNFELFADLMCAFTYQEKYASKFPKIVEGNDRVEYQGVGFADCMETAMRNLANIITYLEGKLGVAPKGLTMKPQLQKFYEIPLNSDNASVGHKDVHQNWTDVIENIEGASYDYLVYQGKKIASHCDGFIFIDNLNDLDKTLPKKSVELNGKTIELVEKNVGERTYLLVAKNPELFGCELMPNLSNMVVVLNNLFNLQLYPSSKDVIEPDFASKYLQLACEKLGWTLRSSSKIDGLKAELNITCKQGDFKMWLSNKVHGSLSVAPKDQLKINLAIPEDTSQSRIAVAMSDQLATKDQIPQALRQSCLTRNVDAVSYDARLKAAKDMLKNWTTLSVSEKNYIQKMIVSFGLHADRYYLESIINSTPSTFEYKDLLFNTVMMFSLKNQHQFLSLINQIIRHNLLSANKVNNLLLLLEKHIIDTNFDIRAAMISFNSLITNKLITTEQVLPFLQKLIDSKYPTRYTDTLLPMSNLIKKDLITFDQALPFLQKNINNFYLKNDIIYIIYDFIKYKAITFDQALPFLQEGISSSDEITLKWTISAIEALANSKSITFDQALPFIEKGINNQNGNIKTETIQLIKSLISNKLMSVDLALPFLEKDINNSDLDVRLNIMSSINSLITNKLMNADQALPFLEKVLGPYDREIQKIAISSLKSLITENLINSDQLKQLQPKLKICSESFDLDTLQIMVDKKLINLDTAYYFAKRNMVKKNDPDYQNFSKHMNAIFNVDQIAQKGIDSTNDADLMKTIRQLNDLLYLDFDITSKDISKILQVAEKGLNSTNKTIIHYSTYIFQKLIGEYKTNINPDEIQTITQRLLELKDIGALRQMCYLNLISANKSDQLITIIKEKLNSSDPEKEIDLENSDSEQAINLVESMIPKLITTDQIKELITAAPKYKTVLEKLLIKAQTLEPKMTGEGMLSRGAFKTTPVASMRHEPYATDIVSRELAQRSMSAREVGEEFGKQYAKDRARLMHMHEQSENEYHIPDLELERQKFEERQTMMSEKSWDDANHPTDFDAGIDTAARLSIAQQRRLMQQAIARNRLKLPTARELGRQAARGARGAIL